MDFAISLDDVGGAAPVEGFRIMVNGNINIGGAANRRIFMVEQLIQLHAN